MRLCIKKEKEKKDGMGLEFQFSLPPLNPEWIRRTWQRAVVNRLAVWSSGELCVLMETLGQLCVHALESPHLCARGIHDHLVILYLHLRQNHSAFASPPWWMLVRRWRFQKTRLIAQQDQHLTNCSFSDGGISDAEMQEMSNATKCP